MEMRPLDMTSLTALICAVGTSKTAERPSAVRVIFLKSSTSSDGKCILRPDQTKLIEKMGEGDVKRNVCKPSREDIKERGGIASPQPEITASARARASVASVDRGRERERVRGGGGGQKKKRETLTLPSDITAKI